MSKKNYFLGSSFCKSFCFNPKTSSKVGLTNPRVLSSVFFVKFNAFSSGVGWVIVLT